MALLFHTTTYKPERAQAEIQRLLLSVGARKVSAEYERFQMVGMSFVLETPRGEREFLLPVRPERVKAVLARQGLLIRSRADQHAAAVAWRTMLEWLKVQLAIIETDQAAAAEVMLPYMIVETEGHAQASLYEHFASDERMLPAPGERTGT